MAAVDRRNEWWIEKQRRREERMRYEILHMLYEAASRCADVEVVAGSFATRLGVWHEELTRALDFLDARGYVRQAGTGDAAGICLTVRGVDYIERDARRRKSIRD